MTAAMSGRYDTANSLRADTLAEELLHATMGGEVKLFFSDGGRGLHSSTSQLNLRRF